MNQGKIFETDFKKSVPQGVYYLRLTDSAIGFDVSASTQRFAPKNPYDCLLFDSPYLLCFELKSTAQKSISFEGKTPMIKQHQIDGLFNASFFKNVVAGFIFNFRKCENATYFLSIGDFLNFKSITNKKSINIKDVQENGGLPIGNHIMRSHYHYEIAKLIGTIKWNRDESVISNLI